MKIYGIAEQGNFGGDEYIQKQGGWGFYKFPPFFKTREAAEKWIEEKGLISRHVEELELED